jgi:N-methylhydantoinase A
MALRLGIDTGGTFTDLIGVDEETADLVVARTPSTPARPVDAVIDAIARGDAAPDTIGAIIIGTTVATNGRARSRRSIACTSSSTATRSRGR